MAKKNIIIKKKKKTTKRPAATQKEVTILGKLLRTAGRVGGGMVGGAIGYPTVGAGAGQTLGAALSRWLGSGDYTVQQNSVVNRTLKGSTAVPMMHRTDQTVVIRHREFIQTINGGTDFNVRANLPLNPGLPQTFPWLSQIAANFQEYRFMGLVFHYVPTSGMATGADTRLGAVMAQTVYRATDTTPATKYELLNEFWSNESLPSEAMAHPIECKPSETVLTNRYVRTGAVTDDLMFYDYGRTVFATQGQIQAGLVGDLWVTYEVELRKPKLTSTLGQLVRSALFNNTGASIVRPQQNSALEFSSFTGLIIVDNPADNEIRITIPPGNAGAYSFEMAIAGSTLASSGTPGYALTNAAAKVNALETTTIPTLTAGTARLTMTGAFRVLDPTATAVVRVIGHTLSGTLTRCVTRITQIDSDVLGW